MDQGKLYSALLKSQQRQQASTPTPPVEEKHRVEAPYTVTEEERLDTERMLARSLEKERPPVVYNPADTLRLIANPSPLSNSERQTRKIIYSGMANKAILDVYRTIRIKLRKRIDDDKNFSVLITSLSKNTNATLTAFNLATSFAMQQQSAALFIDCNPYDSGLAELIDTPLDKGVTDYINDPELKVKDIMYPSGIDRLSVIPAGTLADAATELFTLARMNDLMEDLKERYPDRFIIVNAPSLLQGTEASVLERYMDQTALSILPGEVTREDISAAVDTLNPKKFAGLIFQQ
ncbi:P-loop NTPase family protein [Salinibius halmophilus]|uniref:polysaccharide biosynthesis protein n=1 Tax=Salinibius halmophilus TaxID=1853216 RepID=UPI000E660B0F|nr:polysaccharide biosynthesis protein [Salinibius halmophilus]